MQPELLLLPSGHCRTSALRSARQTISSRVVHYILFEITYYLFGGFTTLKYVKLLQWLSKLGYRLFHVETGNLLQQPKSSALPGLPEKLAAWLEHRAKACNPEKTSFCQAGNIFAVHPKAIWPLRPDRIS